MTVVNIQGEVIDPSWRSVEDGEEIESLNSAIVSLATLKEHVVSSDQPSLSGVGVRLSVDDDLSDIADHAQHLGLIELVFSQFKDGRPFSAAVTLRRDYGFTGELRASGDILPDQALFLVRCGFSTISVPPQFSVEQFMASLAAYSVAYQPAIDSHVSLSGELRKSTVEVAAE